MDVLKAIVIHALEENIDNLLESPIRSFTYDGASFFPSKARSKRRPLTDDIDDLIIDLMGEDDWQCFVRVAISTKARNVHNQHIYLIIDDFSSSDPNEPAADVEARAIAWANSI